MKNFYTDCKFLTSCKGVVTALLLAIFIGVPPVSHAAAQQQNKVISVNLKEVTLIKALEYLTNEKGCKLLYNNEQIKAYKGTVTVVMTDKPVSEVLTKCLAGTGFTYRLKDNVYVVSRQQYVSSVNSQTIKGRVVDASGSPVVGATVVLKDARNRGASTNAKGEFEFHVIDQNSKSHVILVSYIGMKTTEATAVDGHPVTVVMQEDAKSVAEIVVTGYTNIDKKSFTGNAVTITGGDLTKASNRNVLSAIQSFDPSFRIVENNFWGSDPNMVPEINIRGNSSIGVGDLDRDASISKAELRNNSNLPIFIMDGFEVSAEKVYDYDITRIENVTILKDAAATAMYGSRAANGIVVITTVAPQPGRVRVNYTMTGEVTVPDLSDYNLMNAREKLEAEVLSGVYDNSGPLELNDTYLSKLNNVLRGVNTYWLSQPLRTVFNHKHSIYIDGGTEDLRFGVDLKYDTQGGVMKKSTRDRMGAGFAFDYRIKGLQIKNYVSYNSTKAKESPYGTFNQYVKKLPYDEMYDDMGNYVKNTPQWYGSQSYDRRNPLYEASLHNFEYSNYDELIDNLSVNYNIIDGLQFKGSFSITKIDKKGEKFVDPASLSFDDGSGQADLFKGTLRQTSGTDMNWNLNAFLAYNKTIQRHSMNFSLGTNIRNAKTTSKVENYRGFPSGIMSKPSYAKEMVGKPSYSEDQNRLAGAFAILNYSYNNIYLADVSLRMDGSSQFGADKRMAPFWSVGGGLNIHNYEFLKKSKAISELKARVTYGQVGKVNFPPYAAVSIYETFDDWYATGYGAYLYYLGNRGLKWEKTNEFNVGLNLNLYDGLLYVKADYYRNKTIDLITDITIPSSSGFTTYKDNLGKIMNKGFEIDLRSTIIKRRDLNVTLYANLAHNKNEILEISESVMSYNDLVNAYYKDKNNDGSRPLTKYYPGGSTTSIFAMKSLGIDPANGKDMLVKRDGTITYDWDAAEQVIVGNTEPKAKGSFGLNVFWKGFTFFTSFLYEFGGQSYNQTLVSNVENADIYRYNADRRVLTDRWQKPGDVAPLKNIADRSVTTNPTSRFVQDDNWLQLSSMSLGYDFPVSKIKKYGLSVLRLQLNTNSLFKATSVKEERGLYYPYARTFGFTLNLGF